MKGIKNTQKSVHVVYGLPFRSPTIQTKIYRVYLPGLVLQFFVITLFL